MQRQEAGEAWADRAPWGADVTKNSARWAVLFAEWRPFFEADGRPVVETYLGVPEAFERAQDGRWMEMRRLAEKHTGRPEAWSSVPAHQMPAGFTEGRWLLLVNRAMAENYMDARAKIAADPASHGPEARGLLHRRVRLQLWFFVATSYAEWFGGGYEAEATQLLAAAVIELERDSLTSRIRPGLSSDIVAAVLAAVRVHSRPWGAFLGPRAAEAIMQGAIEAVKSMHFARRGPGIFSLEALAERGIDMDELLPGTEPDSLSLAVEQDALEEKQAKLRRFKASLSGDALAFYELAEDRTRRAMDSESAEGTGDAEIVDDKIKDDNIPSKEVAAELGIRDPANVNVLRSRMKKKYSVA